MDKKHKKQLMDRVSLNCQNFRIANGCTQSLPATFLGCSIENVSSFENARNDSYIILLWYLSKGMTYEQITEGIKWQK